MPAFFPSAVLLLPSAVTPSDAPQALRAAQLEQLRLLRAGRVSVSTPFGSVVLPEHPSLWAGFVLIGAR